MICADCAIGGAMNASGNPDQAVKQHEICRGNCDCQHATGEQWVNRG
jgi:hypothetical protein